MEKIYNNDPIFELSDVVDFSGVDPRRIHVWIHRGIVTTAHKPEGKGDVRKYTLCEMVSVRMLARLADEYGLELNAYKGMVKTAAGLVTQFKMEDIGRWVAGKPHSSEVLSFKDDATLPVVSKDLGSGCFVVLDLLDYFEGLVPAGATLGRLILLRKQLSRQR